MQKLPHYIAITLFSVCYAYTQNSEQLFYKNIASQSFTKQNSYFLNPTFTVSNTNTTSLSVLVKNSFKDFQGSPRFNLIGFSGRINEKNGAGIGLFQQTFGVFTSFGAIANYSQQLQITENSYLNFGFNFIINKNTIDRSKINANSTDPAIANFVDTNILAFQPALAYEFGRFNIGVFVKDFLDYDLNSDKVQTNFSDKTIAAHIIYNLPLKSRIRLLEDGFLRFILTTNNTVNSTYSASSLLDIPNLGWLQASYDYLYGIGLGVGVNISTKLSFNFIYEQGKNLLGSSNEIGITYRFDNKNIGNNKNYNYQIFNSRDKKTKSLKGKNSSLENKQITEIEIKPIEENTEVIALETKKLPELDVRIRRLKIDKSVSPGFYLITNVFSNASYANKFMKELILENYDPKYFIHPETKYRYVYIAKTETKGEMMTLYYSNKYRKYSEDKWILHVSN